MLSVTFTELPTGSGETAQFLEALATVSELSEQARANLSGVAADYADLAIRNLSHADGVGHGFPYRPTPPSGVIGWYDDLRDWLVEHRPSMTAPAGVGKDRFNWYLKHVKLMPYDSNQIVTLGLREVDRLWSVQALEQHRNRDLPPLVLSASAEEYEARIAATDRKIRDFLVAEDIITIPDYIGDLDTNVPWIVRPDGPNFWEQVQYRDPTPDRLHAVIPGHRFDGVVEDHNTHPIRGRITSGGRAEGWAVYLEEAMLNAGLLDVQPRVRELIYVIGIFRAARVRWSPAPLDPRSTPISVPTRTTGWSSTGHR
jgi:hypothetical protein